MKRKELIFKDTKFIKTRNISYVIGCVVMWDWMSGYREVDVEGDRTLDDKSI